MNAGNFCISTVILRSRRRFLRRTTVDGAGCAYIMWLDQPGEQAAAVFPNLHEQSVAAWASGRNYDRINLLSHSNDHRLDFSHDWLAPIAYPTTGWLRLRNAGDGHVQQGEIADGRTRDQVLFGRIQSFRLDREARHT